VAALPAAMALASGTVVVGMAAIVVAT